MNEHSIPLIKAIVLKNFFKFLFRITLKYLAISFFADNSGVSGARTEHQIPHRTRP